MVNKAIARVLATSAFCLVLVANGPAFGQRSSAYVPRRATMSPYFGFFQVNTTPLPNYQALVLPRQQIRSNMQREGMRIDRLERQMQLRETRPASSLLRRLPLGVGEPSRAATYMDLDPFYVNQQVVRRRR